MSDNLKNKNVLLIGAGYMAREYVKVLKAMEVNFTVVGNRRESVEKFQNETGIQACDGGIEYWLKKNHVEPDTYIINAASELRLARSSSNLLRNGCKHLLSEKPALFTEKEGYELLSIKEYAEMYIAYNRRFYASSLAAEKIIAEDEGVTSFNIEFTEWKHLFDSCEKRDVLDKLFLTNSSHVVDMAFFLSGGDVDSMTSVVRGQNKINWHKCGSVFGGVRTTTKGQVFTYSANWGAPGRWGVELNTKNHRLILRPLEKLQIQDKGSVRIYEADIDYTLDEQFKPGLYKEVEAFLTGNEDGRLCTLEEQVNKLGFYAKMSGENYSN